MPQKTDNLRLAVGKRLAILRAAKGFHYIRHFAEELDVPEDRYTKWEKGKAMIPAENVEDLRKKYRITSDWLYFGDEAGLTNQLTAEIRKAEDDEKAGLSTTLPVVKFGKGRKRGPR